MPHAVLQGSELSQGVMMKLHMPASSICVHSPVFGYCGSLPINLCSNGQVHGLLLGHVCCLASQPLCTTGSCIGHHDSWILNVRCESVTHVASLDTVLYTVNGERNESNTKVFCLWLLISISSVWHRFEDFPQKFYSFTLSEEQLQAQAAEGRKS